MALNVALTIVIYLDRRNPMMGFLVGAPFTVLIGAACLCSLITAMILYGDWRRRGHNKKNLEKIDCKK